MSCNRINFPKNYNLSLSFYSFKSKDYKSLYVFVTLKEGQRNVSSQERIIDQNTEKHQEPVQEMQHEFQVGLRNGTSYSGKYLNIKILSPAGIVTVGLSQRINLSIRKAFWYNQRALFPNDGTG